jgi:hypothetical protein
MSGPGKGRYTTYVPLASTRNSLLWKLFNKNAANEGGVFYGGQEPSDNSTAAEAVKARATANVTNGIGGVLPANGMQAGDSGMFPTGVDLSFGNSPDITTVKWTNSGDPANGYVPDTTSPGAGPAGAPGQMGELRVDPLDKNSDPKINVADLKPNYIPGAPGTGTVSPSSTSADIGSSPIGKDLSMGKSSV